jgi:hypothetical protein
LRQRHAVLQQIEHPDREQDVAEDRTQDAGGARQDREQGGRIEGRCPTGTLAERGDHGVDPFADGVWYGQARVDLREAVDLRPQLVGEPGQVLQEPDDLVDQRRERQTEELHDEDDRDHVDDEDRHRASHAVPRQPADGWVEEIHDQEAHDEGPDRIACHPEDDADDDRGPDQDDDAR